MSDSWVAPAIGSPTLFIPLEQSLAIQAWLAEGVDRAAEYLTNEHAIDTELTVLETLACPLADFSTDGLVGEADRIAGVVKSFRGRLEGTGLLALDPEEALAWSLADGDQSRPVETYIELGETVLQSIADVAGEALGIEVEAGPSRLEETTVAGCLVGTHAPPDVVLLPSRVEIRVAGQWLSAELHLLMPPKVLSRLLRALAVGVH